MSTSETLARHAPAVRSRAASLRRWAADNEARALAAAAYLVALVVMLALVVSATVGDGTAPMSNGGSSKPAVRAAGGERTATARAEKKDPARSAARVARERRPPTEEEIYHVQSGDTLSSIAARFGTTVDHVLALNPGVDPYMLNRGQRIRVR